MKLYHRIINKLSVALMVMSVAGITSCKKLIEIPGNPPTEVQQEMVFNDSSDIMSAMAGVYLNFKIAGGGQNIFSGMITEYIGCASDELAYSYGNSFLTNTYVATDGTAGNFWSSAYQNIYYINACLQGITSTGAISDSLKESLLGELKMVRAMNYFYLVNLYGGVPIVTSIDYKANAILPRSSVDSVYDFILSDLMDARKVLKPSYPSEGRARPNLYTADALLARVYLYRGQYAQADALASDVINSGLYSLVAPGSVFLQGSNEAIWQVPAIGTSQQTAEAYALLPFSIYSAPNWQATNYLLDSFETNDLRKTSWIGVSTINGTSYNYINKYKQRSKDSLPAEGYVMFRLAEQYLIRAEALAQQNKLDSASADLNKIRTRAGLPNSTASTKEEIINAVMHEREIEFFCEWGHRWFDLKRTGRIDAVLSKIKSGWVPEAALLPVPYNELQNDPYLTQNPGY
ncbi:hypothetical protein A9P82_10110 [Arachidicoccus ginsenosidimutans]|uniref:RagB/SusD family nutrient uptake outer membrane protein n=1 Tax=Arachidicoccus sp. BS20 TaxID=1850526 RepID=UPI0007F14864|nr:RagB/SusD family nutrient uptake outer membrane protein [Arachidicoccus sp. BS20]ANI89611.1 hypothetical protein A9P82_10110 [Arachidicoccus sp. BS20]